MNEELRKKIIEDFGLMKMGGDEQDKFIDKIGNLLFESVLERSVDSMDEGLMGEFEECVAHAGEDYQKILNFLKDRIPTFSEIVSDEMARLKRATSGIFA